MKNFYKEILNILLTPFRLIISHDFANKIGLDSVRDERNNIALTYVRGRLLDIGCGSNLLVKRYGNNSIGVDVYDFGAGATIINNPSNLPFNDKSFDTVTFIASFNHIPDDREKVLDEVSRVLKADGIVIITMLNPFIGKIRHMMRWIDTVEEKRLTTKGQYGEKEGLSYKYIYDVFSKYGYKLKIRKRFLLLLNNLYVFQRDCIVIKY